MDAQYAILWTVDQKVRAVLQRNSVNTYAVHNLPPDRYCLGLDISMDEQNSIPVDLLPGQQLVMDLDDSYFIQQEVGWLEVSVVDENGSPLEGTKAYLQAGERIIEPKISAGWQIFFITTPGPHTLRVTSPGYEIFEQAVLLEPRESDMPASQRQKVTVRISPDKEEKKEESQ